MSKPTKPLWAYGDPSYVIEPSGAKKITGWLSGEKPPFQYMNWIHLQSKLWIDFLESKAETISPTFIRSAGSVAWNGSTGVMTFGSPIQVSFRVTTGEQINQIPAGTLTLGDGDVVVFSKDKTNSSPVTLADGTYATLAAGQYDIVAESSLTANSHENETILFRRRGTDLEIPLMGVFYSTGTTFTFGKPSPSAHVHDAGDITTGTLADARVAQSNVTQHQAALSIAASQITSGTLGVARGGTGASTLTSNGVLLGNGTSAVQATTAGSSDQVLRVPNGGGAPAFGTIAASAIGSGTLADARVAQSNVTQHQAALSLAASQITSGTLPVARGGTGTTTSTGTGSVVLNNSPVFADDIQVGNGVDGTIFFENTSTTSIVGGTTFFQLKVNNSAICSAGNSIFPYFEINADEIRPSANNLIPCGSSARKWTEVWAVNGSIQTSDRKDKKKIKDSDLGLKFLMKTRPVSYEWKKGKDRGRHYGLIAQELKQALEGTDFSGLREEKEGYGLNYSELIGPIIKAIQELNERVERISS